eukprot:3058560-Lingulodinium_polyedra.AAC.1
MRSTTSAARRIARSIHPAHARVWYQSNLAQTRAMCWHLKNQGRGSHGLPVAWNGASRNPARQVVLARSDGR